MRGHSRFQDTLKRELIPSIFIAHVADESMHIADVWVSGAG